MTKFLFQILAISALIYLPACSNTDITDDNSSAKLIEESTTDPGEEYRQQRFSEQELEKMKRNYEILIPHIKISDDSMSYIIDLSEKDALRIGVDKEYYDMTVQSINSTNAALKEAFDNGYKVDMVDFKNLTNPGVE